MAGVEGVVRPSRAGDASARATSGSSSAGPSAGSAARDTRGPGGAGEAHHPPPGFTLPGGFTLPDLVPSSFLASPSLARSPGKPGGKASAGLDGGPLPGGAEALTPPAAAALTPPSASSDGAVLSTVTPESTSSVVTAVPSVSGSSTSFVSDSNEEWTEGEDSPRAGARPGALYGKFTWKIDTFSEISKRELRSNMFDVGGYKWYILVYPHGCDVCNHLSLFLCVADYDKLLPGWSHFAQFTIAIVNKDPKKSKYSDTLHRFCKKEHDWGWKKFMELSKLMDGFTLQDTLVIKAQVQVIRENPARPFRCLDGQYRRELARVYLGNVENLCRRFLDEKRELFLGLLRDTAHWDRVREFWAASSEMKRRQLGQERREVVLKALVKRFFCEKEVTSTLYMDALFTACKFLFWTTSTAQQPAPAAPAAAKAAKGRKGSGRAAKGPAAAARDSRAWSPGEDGRGPLTERPAEVIALDNRCFRVNGDLLALLERAARDDGTPLLKADGAAGTAARGKEASGGDEPWRDDRQLMELGLKTVEMFVLAHLFSTRVEVAFRELEALKRQEELIKELEEDESAQSLLRKADKERKGKKKQRKRARKAGRALEDAFPGGLPLPGAADQVAEPLGSDLESLPLTPGDAEDADAGGEAAPLEAPLQNGVHGEAQEAWERRRQGDSKGAGPGGPAQEPSSAPALHLPAEPGPVLNGPVGSGGRSRGLTSASGSAGGALSARLSPKERANGPGSPLSRSTSSSSLLAEEEGAHASAAASVGEAGARQGGSAQGAPCSAQPGEGPQANPEQRGQPQSPPGALPGDGLCSPASLDSSAACSAEEASSGDIAGAEGEGGLEIDGGLGGAKRGNPGLAPERVEAEDSVSELGQQSVDGSEADSLVSAATAPATVFRGVPSEAQGMEVGGALEQALARRGHALEHGLANGERAGLQARAAGPGGAPPLRSPGSVGAWRGPGSVVSLADAEEEGPLGGSSCGITSDVTERGSTLGCESSYSYMDASTTSGEEILVGLASSERSSDVDGGSERWKLPGGFQDDGTSSCSSEPFFAPQSRDAPASERDAGPFFAPHLRDTEPYGSSTAAMLDPSFAGAQGHTHAHSGLSGGPGGGGGAPAAASLYSPLLLAPHLLHMAPAPGMDAAARQGTAALSPLSSLRSSAEFAPALDGAPGPPDGPSTASRDQAQGGEGQEGGSLEPSSSSRGGDSSGSRAGARRGEGGARESAGEGVDRGGSWNFATRSFTLDSLSLASPAAASLLPTSASGPRAGADLLARPASQRDTRGEEGRGLPGLGAGEEGSWSQERLRTTVHWLTRQLATKESELVAAHQRLSALEQQQHAERQRVHQALARCREHCSHAEGKCSWPASLDGLWDASLPHALGGASRMTAEPPGPRGVQQGNGEGAPPPASTSASARGEGKPTSSTPTPSGAVQVLLSSLHARAAGPSGAPGAAPAAAAGSSHALRGPSSASSTLSYRDACTRPAPEAQGGATPGPNALSPSGAPSGRHAGLGPQAGAGGQSGRGAHEGAPAQAPSGSGGELELLSLAGRSCSEQLSQAGAEGAGSEGQGNSQGEEEGKGHRRALSLDRNGDASEGTGEAAPSHASSHGGATASEGISSGAGTAKGNAPALSAGPRAGTSKIGAGTGEPRKQQVQAEGAGSAVGPQGGPNHWRNGLSGACHGHSHLQGPCSCQGYEAASGVPGAWQKGQERTVPGAQSFGKTPWAQPGYADPRQGGASRRDLGSTPSGHAPAAGPLSGAAAGFHAGVPGPAGPGAYSAGPFSRGGMGSSASAPVLPGAEEFPHLALIADLLNEDSGLGLGVGMGAAGGEGGCERTMSLHHLQPHMLGASGLPRHGQTLGSSGVGARLGGEGGPRPGQGQAPGSLWLQQISPSLGPTAAARSGAPHDLSAARRNA